MSTPRKRRKPIVCDVLDWKVEPCNGGHIHIKLFKPGAEPYEVAFDPEDAYDFREDIGRAYDKINGI